MAIIWRKHYFQALKVVMPENIFSHANCFSQWLKWKQIRPLSNLVISLQMWVKEDDLSTISKWSWRGKIGIGWSDTKSSTIYIDYSRDCRYHLYLTTIKYTSWRTFLKRWKIKNINSCQLFKFVNKIRHKKREYYQISF